MTMTTSKDIIQRIANPSTVILTCTCRHQFQDKRYGKGLRVHNGCKKDGKHIGYCCTVCGNKRKK